MRLQFILAEIFTGLRRNISMIVSVVLVAMISMFFLGAGLLAQREVDLAKGYWYDKVQVTIFLCTPADTSASCNGEVTAAQQAQIKRDLDTMQPLVEKVYFESAADAYKRFQQQFKNSPGITSISPQAMPASYRVKLSDPSRYQEIVDRFAGRQGVLTVSDQRQVLDTFFKLLNVVSVGAVGLAVVMVVCAALLIATTVRQVAFSRRKEVGIMRLVGASAAVIYLPFVAETALAALVGAGLAVGVLWATVHYGVSQLFNQSGSSGELISLIGTHDVYSVAPWLCLGAVFLALVTSWLTLRRYIRV